MSRRIVVGRAAAGLSLGLIALATLPPNPPTPLTHAFHGCLFCGDFGGEDFLLNVLLFVPLGAALAVAGVRAGRAVLAAILVSAVVELLQLFVISGRSSTLGDLVANTLGGLTGVIVARWWHEIVRPRPVVARWLAGGAAALWLLLLALGAWGAGLSLPRTVYWTQWQPDLGQFDRYGGVVLDGTLDGTPLPPPFAGGSAVLRQRLTSGPIRLGAVATAGPPTARIAPILSVFDEHQVEVLVLGQQGRSLVFRVRSRAADLRLRPPAIALDDFFPAVPGVADTLRVLAEHTGDRLDLAATMGHDERRTRVQAFSPLLVWSYFVPFDLVLGGPADLLSALTGLLLAFPLGLWLPSAARRPAIALALGSIVVAVGLGPLPLQFGLPVAPWWQWAASLAGLVAGVTLGRAIQRGTLTTGGHGST